MRSRRCVHLFLYVAVWVVLVGCGGTRPFVAPEPLPDDRYTIPPPEYRGSRNNIADGFDKQFVFTGKRFFDPGYQVRRLIGRPKEAYNVDAFDGVPNSSWFINRNAHRRVAIEEIVRGPDTCDGPDTSDVWTVIRAKAEGVTPGFTIEDRRGDKYVIKFDPPGCLGANSGSEVIGTKLFYAAGYHVPENYIAYFHPRILRLGEGVTFTDEKGRRRHMTEADLEAMLARVEYGEDGMIRATASKYISGQLIGPFRYQSTRKDDPNDLIPHQHRRELRGLGVVSAWLNHVDTKGANSMDSYVTEEGRSYVRHYLMDFGTILGAAGVEPKSKFEGHENQVDPNALVLRILTLGFYVPDWERVPDRIEYPCVGRYESPSFHPGKFNPSSPNPAFEQMTDRDGYWGAKLVTSFTDEQLRAVVAEAQYPDPEAAAYLVRTLAERRDKTGRYWFSKVTPLDRFELTIAGDGKPALDFVDLAVEAGLASPEEATYRYRLCRNGTEMAAWTETGPETRVVLPEAGGGGDEWRPEDQWKVVLQVKRGDHGTWSKWVKVYLREDDASSGFRLLGVRRQ